MRKVILAIILLICGINLKAQVWAEQTSVWHYSYWNIGEGGFIKIEYNSDTVLLNRNCQKLEVLRYRFFSIPNVGMIFAGAMHLNPEFTSVSGDTVFYWINNEFRVLYSFNAQVGDSWDLGVDTNGNFLCSKSIVVVDSIGTMLINNKMRRWLHLRSIDSSSVVLNGKVIEGIGSTKDYLFPVIHNCNPAICPEIDNMQFLCFESLNLGSYNPVNTICEPYLGLENIKSKDIIIYPNPATDYIYIENITEKAKIEIYKMDGMLQQSTNVNSTINIRNLHEGLYLVKIQTDMGVVVKKFVKQ